MGNKGSLEGGDDMKRILYLATILALLTLVVAAPAMAQGVATDQYAAAAQYQYGAAGAQYGAAVLPPTGGIGLLPLAAGVALLFGGLFGGLALRERLQRS
jgi:opacity protein-like surface antigen